MDDRIINLIASHEGYRCMPYLDTKGTLTVGIGYNLEANPLNLSAERIAQIKKHGIGEVESKCLLLQMLEILAHQLAGKLDWWSKLNLARQAVFLDMAYNMGIVGLLGSKLAGSSAKPKKSGFKNTLACAKSNDFFGAADQILRSKFSKDVNPKNLPDGRNYRLANMMRNGRF